MAVYVVEIGGRAICAFNARSLEEAKSEGESSILAATLIILENDGRPLWDGRSQRVVREAMRDESVKWEASQACALFSGDINDIDETWLTFLVPVRDPTG